MNDVGCTNCTTDLDCNTKCITYVSFGQSRVSIQNLSVFLDVSDNTIAVHG